MISLYTSKTLFHGSTRQPLVEACGVRSETKADNDSPGWEWQDGAGAEQGTRDMARWRGQAAEGKAARGGCSSSGESPSDHEAMSDMARWPDIGEKEAGHYKSPRHTPKAQEQVKCKSKSKRRS